MAATTIGLATVVFGLSEESGVVVQNFTSTDTAETIELSKHNGTHSAVAFSNRRVNISLSGSCSTAPSAGIGSTLGLAVNATAVCSGSYYVTDVSSSQTVDGFQTFDISATKYPFLNS